MLYGTQQKQKGYFNSGRVISVAIVNISDPHNVTTEPLHHCLATIGREETLYRTPPTWEQTRFTSTQ